MNDINKQAVEGMEQFTEDIERGDLRDYRGTTMDKLMDGVRENGTSEETFFETYVYACASLEVNKDRGYVAAFAEGGGLDIEVRIPIEALVSRGVENPESVIDQRESLSKQVASQSARIRQLEEVLREARQKLEIYQPHVSNFEPFSYCQLIDKIDAALKGDPQ